VADPRGARGYKALQDTRYPSPDIAVGRSTPTGKPPGKGAETLISNSQLNVVN